MAGGCAGLEGIAFGKLARTSLSKQRFVTSKLSKSVFCLSLNAKYSFSWFFRMKWSWPIHPIILKFAVHLTMATAEARDDSQCSVEVGEFCLVWVSSLTKEGGHRFGRVDQDFRYFVNVLNWHCMLEMFDLEDWGEEMLLFSVN